MTGRRLRLDWGLIEQRRVAAGLTRAELAELLNRAGGTSAYWWPSGAVLAGPARSRAAVGVGARCTPEIG